MTRNEEAAVDVAQEDILPPERQVMKLKRFLETVYNFSRQSSSEMGDNVRGLIVSLVNDELSPGRFFQDLQASTEFPLRPYVVPFLHSSLPHLRSQYPHSKTNLWRELFPDVSPRTPISPCQKSASVSPVARTKKRKALSDEIQPGGISKRVAHSTTTFDSQPIVDETREEGIRRLGFVNGDSAPSMSPSNDLCAWYNDEWRHIETMFTSLASTMERLRYAMLMFQQKARLNQAWNQHMNHKMSAGGLVIDNAQRRTDITVNQVRRTAIVDAHNVIAAAEQRTTAALSHERQHFESMLTQMNQQEDKLENCWNCGRKAGQTCSGCSRARYCGSFCQHKDWHKHRFTCNQLLINTNRAPVPPVKQEPVSPSMSSRASPKSI